VLDSWSLQATPTQASDVYGDMGLRAEVAGLLERNRVIKAEQARLDAELASNLARIDSLDNRLRGSGQLEPVPVLQASVRRTAQVRAGRVSCTHAASPTLPARRPVRHRSSSRSCAAGGGGGSAAARCGSATGSRGGVVGSRGGTTSSRGGGDVVSSEAGGQGVTASRRQR
jgi:hypothetical protein